MRPGYFAEQEELIEDLEKYDEKLKQFYEGLQLLDKKPEKSAEMIKDSLEYFEKFSEKHDKKDRATSIDLDETRERLKNYFEDNDFRKRFTNLRDLDLSNYDFERFSNRKNKDRDRKGGNTITRYELGTDFEPIDMGDLFDLAERVTNYGTNSGSAQSTANEADRSDFFDFVDNDLDMSEFKNYTE